jgi:hypothetical protein
VPLRVTRNHLSHTTQPSGLLPLDGSPKRRPPKRSYLSPCDRSLFFSYDTNKGDVRESDIVILSSASYDLEKKFGSLRFNINNTGKFDVRMFLNFPNATKYLSSDSYFPAGKEVSFEVPVYELPEPRPTTVIFFNEEGKIAALDTAGLYVPARGTTKFSDEELCKEH